MLKQWYHLFKRKIEVMVTVFAGMHLRNKKKNDWLIIFSKSRDTYWLKTLLPRGTKNYYNLVKSMSPIGIFFYTHWQLTGQQGKGGDNFLFHSTTSKHSQTFRYLFVILHVKWLSHIFNCTACIYQNATRWDLPPYQITTWLINDVMLIFCLFTWWFNFKFLLQQFDTGNWWTRTCIDFHPCITSKPTVFLCLLWTYLLHWLKTALVFFISIFWSECPDNV